MKITARDIIKHCNEFVEENKQGDEIDMMCCTYCKYKDECNMLMSVYHTAPYLENEREDSLMWQDNLPIIS